MYDIESYVGKTITIKFNNGIEAIASCIGFNAEDEIITVKEPRVVVINDKELALIPYMLTGDLSQVFLPLRTIQCIATPHVQSDKDYTKIIKDK